MTSAYGDAFYFQDGRGNVTHLTGPSNNVIEHYNYFVSGQPTYLSGNSMDNRFLFEGALYVPEAEIYDMRNRFYHPNLGRFMQTDPIGLQTEGEKLSAGQKALFSPGGSAPEAFSSSEMNLFRYCDDDPVDRSDPFGLEFSDRAFDPQESIPGKFGNTEFALSVGVGVVRSSDGTFALQIHQYDVAVRTKQFATHANGHPRTLDAIKATKEHENLHVAHAREIHDANQNRTVKTGLTEKEAESTRKDEQRKIADQFSSAARRDQQDCKRAGGEWAPIVERERKK
jgi:RHS repeat-associated protein